MLARLTSARRHVDALRGALLSSNPDELERGLSALDEAIACLRSVESELHDQPREAGEARVPMDKPAVVIAAEALRDSLEIAQRLVAAGAALNQGHLQILGAAAGGYTSTGTAAPLHPNGHVSVEG